MTAHSNGRKAIARIFRRLSSWLLLLLILTSEVAATVFQSIKTEPFDTSKWRLVRRTYAALGKSQSVEVLLLKSVEKTGEGGAGQPLNDVERLVLSDAQVIYEYTKAKKPANSEEDITRFFIDDELIIQGVTNDGLPEIIFHSGQEAASDYDALEHILSYVPEKQSFVDIAPDQFFQSGTQGLKWLLVKNRYLLIASKRGEWPASTPPSGRCHYCSSEFVFEAYGWNPRTSTFALISSFKSKELHGNGDDALNGEWAFIEATLR